MKSSFCLHPTSLSPMQLTPATLLPFPDDNISHNCITMMDQPLPPWLYLQETPFPNALQVAHWWILFKGLNGNYQTGYAIVSLNEIIESGTLPNTKSAQQAKLHALTKACLLAKDKTASIYTDSRYAFWVTHAFAMLWKWGFLTSSGQKIKNKD